MGFDCQTLDSEQYCIQLSTTNNAFWDVLLKISIGNVTLYCIPENASCCTDLGKAKPILLQV